MSKAQRCALLTGLAVMAFASVGCNPFAASYFVAYALGLDQAQNVKVKFPANKTIAIVTYAPHTTRIEFGQVDKELNDQLYKKLQAYIGQNNRKYKCALMPASKVHKWLDEHPDWHDLPAEELAKGLGVDFVIYLDIQNLGFYEPKQRFFYQGHAEIKLKVVNADPEYCDIGLLPEEYLTFDFPTEARPIQVDSLPFHQFRRVFLGRVVEKLSWYFVPHDSLDESKHNF
jgi:hypothetical protein